jgi:HSP20 family molecular chaperone IbpA
MRKVGKIMAAMTLGGALAMASASMTPVQNAPADPFADMDRIFEMQLQQMRMMQRQMDRLFQNFERNFQTPALIKTPILVHSSGVLSSGFKDKGDHYELTLKVGDLKNSKINITSENGMLTVEVAENRKVEKQQGNYGKIISYTNRSSVQSFSIPQDADPESIKAEKDKNIITVTVKKKKSNTKHIRIRKKR